MKKTLKAISMLLVLLLVLAGCGSGGTESAAQNDAPAADTPAASGDAPQAAASGDATWRGISIINPETGNPWRIGWANFAKTTEYGAMLSEAEEAACLEAGVEFAILDANYDVNTQLSQIETLVTEGYDAIVINPVDSSAMQNAMETVHAAGIPIFCVNTNVDDPSLLTAFIGSDDVLVGELIAEYVCEAIGGEGGVVVLEGVLGMSSEVHRSQGIDNILPNYPGVQVLARKTANWSREEAMTTMENWIQSFGDEIKGVISENDEMALGSMSSLEAAGITGVVTIGVDGLQDGIQAVADGRLSCTYLQDAKGQAYTTLEVALRALNGESVDSDYDVPWQLVDASNVQDYLGTR